MNILFIVAEEMRRDCLSLYGNSFCRTENLDALAASGTFTDAAQTTQPTGSGPAWSSFLIGVWPEKHGVTVISEEDWLALIGD